jgi:hypothetical protein
MPTSTTTTASEATPKTDRAASFVVDTAKQSSEQILGVVRQTAKFSIDAASNWFETVASIVPVTPELPFAPSKAILQQWINAGYETAESVLVLQRDLASEMVTKLVPAS